jgi:hypothetical protein
VSDCRVTVIVINRLQSQVDRAVTSCSIAYSLAERSEERAMSPSEMRALTAKELSRVPRGGFVQNMYRMLLQQYLMNSLGSSPEVLGASGAHAAALRSVRESFPDFEPVVLVA